jgi:hypothetical protein
MSDEYVKVTARIMATTRNAFFFDVSHDDSEIHRWIPKSLVHGGDVLKIERSPGRGQVAFRLMAWKAEELDL